MAITKGSFSGRPVEERAVASPPNYDLRDDAPMPDEEYASKRSGKTVTLKKKGKPTITFQEGGLHESTDTPAGQKIPASKMAAAKAGKYGPKAQKQANFAGNVLAKGRQTAAKGGK